MYTLRTIQLILLIAITAMPGISVPLQRSRKPSTTVVLPSDLAGMFQPESVRSIILLYLAKEISKPKANELEAEIRKNPENLDDRISLIGYYSWNGRTPADRQRLRTHVLWLLGNHPEHPAVGEPSVRDLPDDPEGNRQILALWDRNLELRGDDLNVLKNAEKFFFAREPAKAERILRQLHEKEPGNQQWPNELIKLYVMFGLPDFDNDRPSEKAAEAYSRVLQLTSNPAARELIASDMAQATFKTGDFAEAAQFAKIDLQTANPAAAQRANTILGRVALRSGDLNGAKQYLLDSAVVAPGQTGLAFSPTMVLAKELLEKGERDAVVEYLEDCKPLWPRGRRILQSWIADIKDGLTPNFGSLSF